MKTNYLSGIFRLLPAIAIALLVASCGSHRKSSVSAGSSGSSGYSKESIVKTMGAARYGALPEASRRLLKEADGWLGVPYAYGGTDRKKGVDCSGLTTMVYLDAFKIKLPRSSASQQEWCDPLKSDSLMIGDLVFFSPRGKKGNVGHVGIYVGDGRIIHSSSSKGVIVSNLSDDYFRRTYHSSGRVAKYYAMLDSDPRKSSVGRGDRYRISQPEIDNDVRSVSLDNLDNVLASSKPKPIKAATQPQTRTSVSEKNVAQTDTLKETITTVRVSSVSTATNSETPEEARRRALLKLKIEE